MRPKYGFRIAANWRQIRRKTMTSQFSNMMLSSTFLTLIVFPLSSFVTGPRFMSISWLVLELWQFSFLKNWPKIQKSDILPSLVRPMYGDWVKLDIPNLARMSLIKSYWILQNTRVAAKEGVKLPLLKHIKIKTFSKYVTSSFIIHEKINTMKSE